MADAFDKTFFAPYRRNAILLYRPYPPHSGPLTNSKFGGLPRLPSNWTWPQDASGTPLHFLAQIDCSDIKVATQLPNDGVLFFFGRDDEEQVWDDSLNSSAVIYSPDATALTPLRSPPHDLPPIGGYYVGGNHTANAWKNLLFQDDAGPKVHVEWPIQPLQIDTWPESLFENIPYAAPNGWLDQLVRIFDRTQKSRDWEEKDQEERQKDSTAYFDRYQALRTDAFIRATGKPVLEFNLHSGDREAGQRIFEHASSGPDAFPQFWISIEYAARAFIGRFRGSASHNTFDEKQLPRAQEWVRRAQTAGGGMAVGENEKADFRAWLMKLRKGPRPFTPDAECVFEAVRLNIRSWAGDPTMSAKISPFIYSEMEPFMSSNSVLGLQYSQMLGHAPSAQDAFHPDYPYVCLLSLASDQTLGWMFGDVGNATFFISPEALATHEFSQVEAVAVGH